MLAAGACAGGGGPVAGYMVLRVAESFAAAFLDDVQAAFRNGFCRVFRFAGARRRQGGQILRRGAKKGLTKKLLHHIIQIGHVVDRRLRKEAPPQRCKG